MPGRTVATVVREGDRLGERYTKTDSPGDTGRDLRDLDRVREPGAEVIVFGGDIHLALPREPPPRTRVLDAIEIPLEAQPIGIRFLGAQARARAHWTRRAGREREIEGVLTLFAPQHTPTDERVRVGMRVPDDQLVHFLHAASVPGG